MKNSDGNWELILTNSAEKDLRKLPRDDLKRIDVALMGMRLDPFEGDIEKMGGRGSEYRRRVGNWRIFYTIEPSIRVVIIARVKRRTSTTY